MLVENDRPRNQWRIGSVKQVYPGHDGLVINVDIKLGTKLLDSKGKPIEEPATLRRPIEKLVLLIHKGY